MTASKEVAILMADLSGYTAATEIHGAHSALHLIQTYLRIAEEALIGGSSILERVGDQIVIIADTADDVAFTAVRLLEKCFAAVNFLPIHVGMHYGSVLESEGSFFGTAINVCARIASEASSGEILCSEAFINNLAGKDDFVFGEIKTLKLKNILNPISVASIDGFHTNIQRSIDPVCKMNIDASAKYKITDKETNHYFCSEYCMHIFEGNPQLFTSNYL